MKERFLIYGSYGYTGKLIVEECLQRGLRPVLAGRDARALEQQAEQTGLHHTAFELTDTEEAAEALRQADCGLVLHCAGPFMHTAETMAEACLQAGIHYLDITGEFEVIEQIASKNERAKEAGIVMLPGVGFDVVPSDCLARYAYEQLQSAELLRLHILFKGGFSAGSLSTAIEHFSKGGASRKRGIITTEKTAVKTSKVYFGDTLRKTILIPWGDLSSAFHSTGIANIEVFMALPRFARLMLKAGIIFQPLMKLGAIRRLFQNAVVKKGSGPDEQERKNGETRILAEVFSINREYTSILLKTPEAYTLTSQTAVESAVRVMSKQVTTGFSTPSLSFGADFILEFDGVSREVTARKGV